MLQFTSHLAIPFSVFLPNSLWRSSSQASALVRTKSQSHFVAFVSVSLPQLASRSGGAFVTGEPLIKFPLHPWPAAGARWDGGGGGGGVVVSGGGLSDSWHWTGLLFLRLKPFWSLWDFGLWAPEPGIAGHDLLMMWLPAWHETEVKLYESATCQFDQSSINAV